MRATEKRQSTPERVVPDPSEWDVLGLAELAERWDVSKQRVSEVTEDRLPPWKRLKCGRLWLLSDVEAFEKVWTRRSGIHITPHKGRRDAEVDTED